jgi:hypothetical protein
VGTPVIEDLQAPEENVGLLNITPGVFDESRSVVGLADIKLVSEDADGDEIAILQAFANLSHIGRDIGA